MKGASEIVVASCNKVHFKSGEVIPLDEQLVKEIEKNIKIMADDALRTIGIAYKPYSADTVKLGDETKNKLGVYEAETEGFILCGIFGIADSIRAEVPQAVRTC